MRPTLGLSKDHSRLLENERSQGRPSLTLNAGYGAGRQPNMFAPYIVQVGNIAFGDNTEERDETYI